MDRNVFAPPTATVADPVETGEPRPQQVTWAMICIWTWLAADIGQALSSMSILLINTALGSSFFLGAILIPLALEIGIPTAFSIWINSSIARGRHWARVLVAVFVALGVVGALDGGTFQGPFNGELALLVVILQAAKILLGIIAAVLLFTPPANRWFKAMA
jgi:hypothetical protein